MKVSQMTTSAFWKGESGVKGLVEDQGKQYKANLYIKGSQVYDYSCSCVQGNSYKGMCPHCQELYREYREKAAENSGRPVTTSQQARTMIREYTNREVAQIMIEGEEKQVQLAVRIIADRSDVKLEFRLGRERFYVLKDLVAFTRAIESGSFVEYGKNLAFHHNLSVFTKESRSLVEFIMELVGSYCELVFCHAGSEKLKSKPEQPGPLFQADDGGNTGTGGLPRSQANGDADGP